MRFDFSNVGSPAFYSKNCLKSSETTASTSYFAFISIFCSILISEQFSASGEQSTPVFVCEILISALALA